MTGALSRPVPPNNPLCGQRKMEKKTLKVKIGVRIFERCLIISKEKPQRLFALFVPCLMTGALSRPVPPSNPLCGQRKMEKKILKVKIGVRIFERCLIISKEKPQRLFALFVPYLMAGALSRPVPPNNPLCGQRKMEKKPLKVKIGVRIFERCLIISKEKPQRLFAPFVPCLMTGALSRPVPPSNPICGQRKMEKKL